MLQLSRSLIHKMRQLSLLQMFYGKILKLVLFMQNSFRIRNKMIIKYFRLRQYSRENRRNVYSNLRYTPYFDIEGDICCHVY